MNSDPDDVSDPEINPFKTQPKNKPDFSFQTPRGILNPIEILGKEERKSTGNEVYFNMTRESEKESTPNMTESNILSRNNNFLFKSIRETEEEGSQSMDGPVELEDLRAQKSKYPAIIESFLGLVIFIKPLDCSEITLAPDIQFKIISENKSTHMLIVLLK